VKDKVKVLKVYQDQHQ